MAITNGYTDTSTFKAWHAGISDQVDDGKIEDVITAVSRWIDGYCHRRFWKDTEATTRTYVPTCRDRLKIDDLVSLTTLKTDAAGDGTFETTWTSSDYQLLPLNPSMWPETRPYNELKAIGDYTFPYPVTGWQRREDRVQISGIFGWPAVPQAVEQACLIQAASVFTRRNSPNGTIGSTDFGVVRVGVRVDPDVAKLLEPYRKHAVLVG